MGNEINNLMLVCRCDYVVYYDVVAGYYVPRCNGQRRTYYQQTAQNYFATDIKKRKKVRGFDGVLRGRSYVELLVLIRKENP